VGRWKLVDAKGVASSYLTLTNSFGATRDHVPGVVGKWEVFGQEARIMWPEGVRDFMKLEEGQLTFYGLGKVTSWDSPPNFGLRAVRMTPKDAPPSKAGFVGRWKLVNDKGVVSAYLTVTTIGATRDHVPASSGDSWEVVGNQARFAWDDGHRDIMREDQGKLMYYGLGKATGWDVPAQVKLHAVRIP
jgi:hypothetical protein